MSGIINSLLAAIMSFFSVLSIITVPMTIAPAGADGFIPTGIELVVDEQKLSENYQEGRWNGNILLGFGHIAKVDSGVLVVDGYVSIYPADSSEANMSSPIFSNSDGTWFMDEIKNEVRHDRRGENLFTFKVDREDWCACTDGKHIYLVADNGDNIAMIDIATYKITPAYTGD